MAVGSLGGPHRGTHRICRHLARCQARFESHVARVVHVVLVCVVCVSMANRQAQAILLELYSRVYFHSQHDSPVHKNTCWRWPHVEQSDCGYCLSSHSLPSHTFDSLVSLESDYGISKLEQNITIALSLCGTRGRRNLRFKLGNGLRRCYKVSVQPVPQRSGVTLGESK